MRIRFTIKVNLIVPAHHVCRGKGEQLFNDSSATAGENRAGILLLIGAGQRLWRAEDGPGQGLAEQGRNNLCKLIFLQPAIKLKWRWCRDSDEDEILEKI